MASLPPLLQQSVQDMLTNAPAPQKPAPASKPNKDTVTQQWIRALLLAAGAGLDIDSTRRATKNGAQESNSALYGSQPSLGRLLAVKGAINLPLGYLFHKMADTGSKKEAMGLAALFGAGQAIPAIHNYANAKK